MTDPRLLLLDPGDNVFVVTKTVSSGESLYIGGENTISAKTVELGHKIAARSIRAGEKIIKYRAPIGSATCDISAGEHVHLHNMKSDYLPTYTLEAGRTFGHSHEDHQ